ncbi:hypothetical protein [Pseudorhodobacter ferrugineus]|uniref:hypothetical protein n=1 Tax=Pseudorhodobacter ferrugineus TaxID=77008 RepID=UPI000A5F5A81|nr:hypothetical protein [Pseudorhodobacter ferrugineus]
MSEPMSSGDIEDVLSSIRRLVSEDLRPAGKDGPAKALAESGAAAKALGPDTGGKLLLTPALRVVSTQNSFPTQPHGDAVADVMPEDAEPETDADDALVSRTAFDSAAEDEDWLPERASDGETYPGWAQADDAIEPESQMGRVVHEIAAGVTDGEDDWEHEGDDATVSAVSWQAPEWVEEAELVDELASTVAARRAMADLAEEAAVAEIMARAAQAKHDADKPAFADKPVSAESDDADDDIFAEAEGYFDETVLRDLVRDLIREELSGTLGERITRNVRKLVRAEINRALTARDFD